MTRTIVAAVLIVGLGVMLGLAAIVLAADESGVDPRLPRAAGGIAQDNVQPLAHASVRSSPN